MTPEERFWSKVEPTGCCWYWQASRGSGGYGHLNWQGRFIDAHRLAYQLLVGPIPSGLQLDHICRVRHCVNPDHLEPVTPHENHRRGIKARQTHCKRGHQFDAVNTHITREGRRKCRKCAALFQIQLRANRRGAVA